jgi:hypothetical protein
LKCRFPRGGGLLSFASPKESKQRKGDPTPRETPAKPARAKAPPNSLRSDMRRRLPLARTVCPARG